MNNKEMNARISRLINLITEMSHASLVSLTMATVLDMWPTLNMRDDLANHSPDVFAAASRLVARGIYPGDPLEEKDNKEGVK